MHFSRTTFRFLTTAASVVLLWLIAASESVAAAPLGPAGKPCGPQTLSIGKLIRQARSVGGPVARRVRKTLTARKVRTAHVERGVRAPATEDGPAIQNDAPATHLSVCPVLALQALGLFTDRIERLPCTTSTSPQSPRGPPVLA
jgi:hypothetical protein